MRVLLNQATRVERISRSDVSKLCRPPRHISPDQAASASPNAGAVCFDGTPGRKPQLPPARYHLKRPQRRRLCALGHAVTSPSLSASLNSITLLAPTPPKRNMIAGRRWIRYRALIIPRRCFVCAGHAKVQWSGTVELRDLFVPRPRFNAAPVAPTSSLTHGSRCEHRRSR
jgi:hypothetical protein